MGIHRNENLISQKNLNDIIKGGTQDNDEQNKKNSSVFPLH